jgi:hypothetical protein
LIYSEFDNDFVVINETLETKGVSINGQTSITGELPANRLTTSNAVVMVSGDLKVSGDDAIQADREYPKR